MRIQKIQREPNTYASELIIYPWIKEESERRKKPLKRG
jgi:hypothetical protein